LADRLTLSSALVNSIALYKQSLLAAAFNNLGKSFAMGLLNECATVINDAVCAGESLGAPRRVQVTPLYADKD
jgi:hypothetical protein